MHVYAPNCSNTLNSISNDPRQLKTPTSSVFDCMLTCYYHVINKVKSMKSLLVMLSFLHVVGLLCIECGTTFHSFLLRHEGVSCPKIVVVLHQTDPSNAVATALRLPVKDVHPVALDAPMEREATTKKGSVT